MSWGVHRGHIVVLHLAVPPKPCINAHIVQASCCQNDLAGLSRQKGQRTPEHADAPVIISSCFLGYHTRGGVGVGGTHYILRNG